MISRAFGPFGHLTIALAAFFCIGLGGGFANAETPPPPAIGADAPPVDEGAEPGAGISRGYASDWRKGTITLSAGVGYTVPVGDLAVDLLAINVLSGGSAFDGALGIGLSRSLSLSLGGSYAMLGGGASCANCTGRSTTFGLGFVYHIVQGLAFDPWGSFGIGYRALDVKAPDGVALSYAGSYQGFDFVRLALGGEFYPTPTLGFGPVFEASVGSYRLRADSASEPSVYGVFSIGLRVTFDPLRAGRVRPAESSVAFSY